MYTKSTSNVYQKHLDLNKRIKIEKGIEENLNFSQIAKEINKSPRTVSYEILKNRNIEHCLSWVGKYKTCEKTLKPPYVCNSCPSRKGCRKTRYYYYAEDAQGKYEKLRSESRTGIDMTSTEFKELNKIVSNEIKNGHSFAMIIRNHKDDFSVGKRTLYNYVEKGYLDIINLDLPRKVRYKVRKQKQNKTKKDYSYRIGRTYEDFLKFLVTNPNINVVEMDTVEGIKGGKVLLTMIFRNFNFMIARLLPNKTSEAVKKELDNIEKIIGTELFKRIFKCILTDNGGEFQRPDELETSVDGSKRCWIFYCDANRSDQKAKVEKNHEYIRYIIPKGTSMDNYNQSDIDLMMSHINSTAREVLNFAIPFDMANIYLGVDTLKKLNISKIQPDNIILKPRLINNKK